MSFSPGFTFYADGRATDGELPAVFWDTCRAELARELDHRRRYYPDRVAKGLMKREEAERELRVWQAITDDWDVTRAIAASRAATWAERLHALRREIALRRQFYPQKVLRGRMTQADADRRLLLIEQLHDMWWHSHVAVAIRAETDASRERRMAA